jgi:4-diphosphocytidyl-2-C-methyl-D-erythritol kinase
VSDGWLEAEARAKVNLRLRIFPRDADGFHPLETVFCRIDWADRLRVRLRPEPGVAIRLTGPESAPAGRDNLAARAAALLLEQTGSAGGVEIELEKRLPPGSGLGGGSSDAAAVLRLLGPRLGLSSERDLLALAPRLGADVAFFLSDVPMALGWGRGQRLLTLPSLERRPMLVLVPAVTLSTARAYARWDELHRSSGDGPGVEAAAISWSSLASWDGIRALARNDFEPIVFRDHPQLRSVHEALAATDPLLCLLSGSGSALFAVYESDAARDAARARLEGELAGVRIVSACGPV